MRTGPVTGVHFPNPPPPLLQATAVTPPGRKPIFHLPCIRTLHAPHATHSQLLHAAFTHAMRRMHTYYTPHSHPLHTAFTPLCTALTDPSHWIHATPNAPHSHPLCTTCTHPSHIHCINTPDAPHSDALFTAFTPVSVRWFLWVLRSTPWEQQSWNLLEVKNAILEPPTN